MVFRAVAHELSFSRAAEKLSLSQPSVSHQIALLETEIGVRVFDRDRGRAGLRLTHAGEVLLEHADHVGWRLQLADSQISDAGRRAPRPGAPRRLPDRARGIRAVRDQAPSGHRRRAPSHPQRGDAEHARTAVSQRRVRRRPRLPGRRPPSAASSRAPSGSTSSRTPS